MTRGCSLINNNARFIPDLEIYSNQFLVHRSNITNPRPSISTVGTAVVESEESKEE